MPGSFDPFHEWLDIPPRDQPANYYRLLGLKLFEADSEVIKRAANRQMGHVEKVRSDDHPQAAATLLEQLAEARRCLLDLEMKKLYDEGLRDGQKSEWKRSRPAATRPATASVDGGTTSAATSRTGQAEKRRARTIESPIGRSTAPANRLAAPATGSVKRPAARRSSWKRAMVVGGFIAGLLVAMLAIFLSPGEPPGAAPTIRPTNSQPEPKQEATDAAQSNADEPHQATASMDPAALEKQTQLESRDEILPEPARPIARDDGRAAQIDSVEPFPYNGMILWLDAADEERIEVDENRRVNVWYDGSDAEHHALPITALRPSPDMVRHQSTPPVAESARPLLVSLPDGLAVLRFSGAQSLTIQDATAFNLADDYSFMLVARGDAGVLLDKGDGYHEGALSFWNGATSVRTQNRTLKSGAVASAKLQVHSLIADKQHIRWHIDGTLHREVAWPHTIDNQEPLLIGCRGKEDDPRYFVGDIAELLIYDRALSRGELVAVEEYLLEKWLSVSGDTELAVAADMEQPAGSASTSDASHRDPIAMADGDESLPAPRGAILREVWLDVLGSRVEDFVAHVVEHPDADEREELDRLEAPEDFADNYGQRLGGYLHPPVTGEYRFSVRANAGGLIFVSTDVQPENKRLIEPGKPVRLQGGAAYYIEAYHKESTGRDYLSVGWTLPDGTEESPIAGERLSVAYRIAPRHQTQFVPLRLVSAEASAGSQLIADDEGRVVVTAASRQVESYRLVFQPTMKRLTALRLEALPHEDLPANGPGLGPGGRFAIDEAGLSVMPRGEAAEKRPVAWARVTSDQGADLSRLADGNEATRWKVSGRGKAASATFFPVEPVSVVDAKLLLTIKNRELLGSFRVSATSAPNPAALKLPPAGSLNDAFLLHVNLGGQTQTAPDGKVWRESKLFDNKTFGHEGGRSIREDDVQNRVQGSALRGIQAFRAIVPAGTYEVTLYFCEYWSTQSTARIFSIAAEQRVVARNMDLLKASGGFGRPLAYPIRNVAVKDGRLDIEFQASQPQASAILNAIRVRQVR